MSTSAQLAANIANAQLSTGARTEAGRAASSKNATTHGLFTKNDFIRPGEAGDYAQAKADLDQALAPAGPLEHNLVDEIHRAIWRLRRCGEIEGTFVATLAECMTGDPMQNDATAKLQLSVDRARSQSHRLLHKCTAELRTLQTERHFRRESFDTGTDVSHLGLCEIRSIRKGLDDQVAAQYRRQKLIEATELSALFSGAIPPPATPPAHQAPGSGSFCKNANTLPQLPRNAPCPCQSGEKYKRCCGKNAPPILHAA